MAPKRLLLSAGIAAALSTSSLASAAQYSVSLVNLTPSMYFTPVIVAAHPAAARMFVSGESASAEMQAIAEGGDTAGMNALLASIGSSIDNGDGLVAPGARVEFTVEGSAVNSVLSLTAMLLPTNDGFAGLSAAALPGGAVGSSRTYDIIGYDAGTEANDELVGSGAPGAPGFPNPPPVAASGTGTGGTGIHGRIEGFVHVHKNQIGDMDPNGGASDINAAIHGWLNPVARVTITKLSDNGDANGSGPSGVGNLSGQVYSSSALEIFWQAASSSSTGIAGYQIERNGELLTTLDGLSLFEEGLQANTEYHYTVRALDSNGVLGAPESVNLTTNSQ
ncbi:MAG: spondin domain-containing protein [Granulosicoccus sp.]